jgi:hypothetical protein
MHLVYVETPSIMLLLTDTLDIMRAQRVRRGTSLLPHVIRVQNLISKPDGTPRFDDGDFQTDGLGCIRLLWWIMNERPNATNRAKRDRFLALFSDNPCDAVAAPLRILFGTEAIAAGENSYFTAQQWRNHPEEMAALALIGSMG